MYTHHKGSMMMNPLFVCSEQYCSSEARQSKESGDDADKNGSDRPDKWKGE